MRVDRLARRPAIELDFPKAFRPAPIANLRAKTVEGGCGMWTFIN
jgi:hypothetical protein